MKSGKKSLALILAGVLVACASLVGAGCLGNGGGFAGSSYDESSDGDSGGSAISGYSGSGSYGGSGYSGSRGSGESSDSGSSAPESTAPEATAPEAPAPSEPTTSALVGTWELTYAHDLAGEAYDLTKIGGSVKLVVESNLGGVFYYFDDEPFYGTLYRSTERDSYYATDGYDTKCYQLVGGDGSRWEFAFCTDLSDNSTFWYLEVGPEDDYDSLYLERTSGDGNVGDSTGTTPMSTSPFEDMNGEAYDLDELEDAVLLVIKSEDDATFYYFDDDPFSGKLVRDPSGDPYYATSGYITECYHLTNSEGRYWEFCFVTDLDDDSTFWYLEVGPEDDYDCLYLARDASYSGSTSGGSGSSGSSGSSSGSPSAGGGTASTVPALAGTWMLDYAHDFTGQAYDISNFANKIKLVVRADETATFYYFDDAPFTGTMMRETTQDSYYDTNPDYTVQCYHLLQSDGSYWELVYIMPNDDPDGAFFYLEVGGEEEPDSLYLAKQ